MKCALCESEDKELRESHIIPKLVYKRIRSHPKSRFRNLSEIGRPLQDGEKYRMLCDDCEEKFSALESRFANQFLDVYLKTDRNPSIRTRSWMNEYIASVSWRILNDDLFRLNSFKDEWQRSIFEEFELYLRHFFQNMKGCDHLSRCKNYIFKLSSLISQEEIIADAKSMIFGYSFFDASSQEFMVIACYAGLIFATTYSPQNVIFFNDSIGSFFKRKGRIKVALRDEFLEQYSFMCKQYDQNMTPELKTKIQKYYQNQK